MQRRTAAQPDEAGAAVALGDGDLVALARGGRPEAFREIMRRNNRRLFRAARAVLRDGAEAEDVVQETYMRAFQGLAAFRGEASLSSWLTRIAYNEALERLRRRRRLIELTLAMGADQEDGGARIVMFPTISGGSEADPEDALARGELRRILEAEIDALPGRFRVVLVARDVNGLSVEETAEMLGLRSETVRTRLHRARRLLHAALEKRLGSSLRDVFPFDGARCARLSEAVMLRLMQAGLTPG